MLIDKEDKEGITMKRRPSNKQLIIVSALLLGLSVIIALDGASHSDTLFSTTANGNPILPPKWAFGILFGSYYDQNLILDAMNKLRNGYCGDLLWVDSSWLSSKTQDAPRYINFEFDSAQFPNPAGMISTLHTNHFKFGVWEWPLIDKSNPLYSFGERNGYFIKDSSGNVVNSDN